MFYNDLEARSVRERVNQSQLWEPWLEAERIRRHSFVGFLDFEKRRGGEYLYSRKRGVTKSLGPRSEKTEAIRSAFHEGRAENKKRLQDLAREMEVQAAICQSLNLGRIPIPAARILRAISINLPSSNLRVVGTNALYAYEALAGVTMSSDSTATGDIDFLVDDRKKLRFVLNDGEEPGIANMIKREVDRTFATRSALDFRMTNNRGYMVEFIRPESRPLHRRMPGSGPAVEGDVVPAAIEGLQWLLNAPAVETVVIDEKGFPAPIKAPDPRVWALHKLWLSDREFRDSGKKLRDRQQADVVLDLVKDKLPHLGLDKAFLDMLPGDLRAYCPDEWQEEKSTTPRW